MDTGNTVTTRGKWLATHQSHCELIPMLSLFYFYFFFRQCTGNKRIFFFHPRSEKKGGDVWMKRHTRPRGHVRSQRYRIPPEHHGFSARGEKRPQWAKPWPQQRSHGAAGRHQRREQRQREPRKKPTQNLSTSRPTRGNGRGGKKGIERHYGIH